MAVVDQLSSSCVPQSRQEGSTFHSPPTPCCFIFGPTWALEAFDSHTSEVNSINILPVPWFSSVWCSWQRLDSMARPWITQVSGTLWTRQSLFWNVEIVPGSQQTWLLWACLSPRHPEDIPAHGTGSFLHSFVLGLQTQPFARHWGALVKQTHKEPACRKSGSWPVSPASLSCLQFHKHINSFELRFVQTLSGRGKSCLMSRLHRRDHNQNLTYLNNVIVYSYCWMSQYRWIQPITFDGFYKR